MAVSLDPISPWAFREGRWSRVLKLASSGVATAPPETVAAPGPSTLTLVTWNTWFGRTKFRERSAALLDELSWRAPEVIALQEATEELVELLVAHPIIRAHYQLSDIDGSSFDPYAGYGVLLLSKIPFVSAGLLHLPSRMGRRLLVGQLSNGLCLATVHLESTAECSAQRAEQLQIIQPFLAGSAEDVVLMGDMNFAPEAPAETAVLDPSFVDGWSLRKPIDPGYSVDSLRNDLRRRIGGHTQKRIDRVFVRGARWQLDDISLTGTSPIDQAGTFTSDHFGLEAVLRRRSPSQP